MASISGGRNRRGSGLYHRRNEVLTIREQSFGNERACALNHRVAIAMSQIFQYGMCDQLVSPTRGDNYLIAKLITRVRQLNRRGRPGCEQHVIADYSDGERRRGWQTSGGKRADVTNSGDFAQNLWNGGEGRGRYIVTLAT